MDRGQVAGAAAGRFLVVLPPGTALPRGLVRPRAARLALEHLRAVKDGVRERPDLHGLERGPVAGLGRLGELDLAEVAGGLQQPGAVTLEAAQLADAPHQRGRIVATADLLEPGEENGLELVLNERRAR